MSADASWLESMPDVYDQHPGPAQQMVARLGEGPVRGDLTALMVSAQHRA